MQRDDDYLRVFDRYYLEALQDGYPVKRAEQIAADAASAFLYQQGRLFDNPHWGGSFAPKELQP